MVFRSLVLEPSSADFIRRFTNNVNSMADSTDTDSQPPTEFPLSSSDEDLLGKTNIKPRKCPLCRTLKQYYLCVNCVKNGDFFHSNSASQPGSQRFIEKKLHLLQMQGNIKELTKLAEVNLQSKNKILHMQREIKRKNEKIQILKQWKSDVEKSLSSSIPILNLIKAQKENCIQSLNKLKNETSESEFHHNTGEKLEKVCRELCGTKSQLKSVIRENLKLLVQCIFPISFEGISSEEDSESLATVKDALADASQQTYVRGQWIYDTMGHGSGQYHIAGAILPGTGDMAAYRQLKSNKDRDDSLRHFKVALSHTTQLSQILAFYLGIRLPKKVAHRDFINNDLDVKRFSSRVARLHANVLFLCTCQGILPVHLRHVNPLARLLTLLDRNVCDLGKFGPFEFYPELWTFEDIEEYGDTVNDSTDEDDTDPLNADWESVAHYSHDDATIRSSHPASSPNAETPIKLAQTQSVVGGVVTSLWSKWPWSK